MLPDVTLDHSALFVVVSATLLESGGRVALVARFWVSNQMVESLHEFVVQISDLVVDDRVGGKYVICALLFRSYNM